MNTKKSRIHTMTQCSMFAALMCICSPLMIPLGAVPLSAGILVVMFTAVVLSPVRAVTSVCVYILIGACGLPVFSGLRGGFSVLAGPTGGYIWSYILVSAFVSFFSRLCTKLAGVCVACILSLVICWLCGALQYAFIADADISEAIAVCVLPFIIPDIIKAVAVAFFGNGLRTIMSKHQF